MMTPTSGKRALSSRVAARPSISGMRTSINTTCGCRVSTCRMASRPSPAWQTTRISAWISSSTRMPWRIRVWSSTSRTSITVGLLQGDMYFHFEAAFHARLAAQRTAELFHTLVQAGQPEAWLPGRFQLAWLAIILHQQPHSLRCVFQPDYNLFNLATVFLDVGQAFLHRPEERLPDEVAQFHRGAGLLEGGGQAGVLAEVAHQTGEQLWQRLALSRRLAHDANRLAHFVQGGLGLGPRNADGFSGRLRAALDQFFGGLQLDAQDGQVVSQSVMDVARQAHAFLDDGQFLLLAVSAFQSQVGGAQVVQQAFCAVRLLLGTVDQQHEHQDEDHPDHDL